VSALGDVIGKVQTWLFEAVVQPALYRLDLASLSDPAYESLEWLIWGLIEIAVLYAILRPLESRRARSRRLLAPPAAAPLRVVVVAACPASQPAPDEFLD
jgi:hypothetical protein